MIKDIVLLQKQEFDYKMSNKFISRVYSNLNLSSDLIKVIMGPRRAGKSFLAMHLITKMGNFGYLNLDDERLISITDYDELITNINLVYNNPKCILFDEIQNLEKWELFVNRLQRSGYNLIITGSNANLLGKELATHLTGRHTKIYLFPLSFKEIIDSKSKDLTSNQKKEIFDRYLLSGGYPEPYVKDLDYKNYLSDLLNSTIYKDIVKRHKIRNPQNIDKLVFYLTSNICSEFTYNALSKICEIKNSRTIEKYLSYLDESMLFFALPRFSYKTKDQIVMNKKIYCIDNGLITNTAFKFMPNYGKLYENVVAITLKKEEYNKKINLYYWRNSQNEEVDFVVKEGLKIKQLIQVSYDIANKKTEDRELRALIKASEELKCNDLLVITSNFDLEKKYSWYGITKKIKYVSLWKWLLKN